LRNFRPVKAKRWLSRATEAAKLKSKGGTIKEMRVRPFLEARIVALLIGLAIGLGFALHEAFFFIALLIALGAAIEWAVEATAEHQHVRHLKLTHRHL
jgi:RsiW-degrading membrane proteinase PrsW (M82 family)